MDGFFYFFSKNIRTGKKNRSKNKNNLLQKFT